MSKAEILEELPRLAPEDLIEIQAKIEDLAGDGWQDADDPLSDEQKGLIESRIEAHDKSPGAAIPWEEFDARLKRRLSD